MSRLLWIELRRLIPSFALLYLIAFVPFHFFDVWLLLAAIPFFALWMSSSILKRSSWYLNLPFSRTKIIGSVLLQNFIVFVSTAALTCLLLIGEVIALWVKDSMLIGLLFFVYCFFAFLAISRNLNGIAIRRPTLEIFATQFIVRILAIFLFVLVGWSIDLFAEPVFYLFFMSSVFSEVTKASCVEFKLPILYQKRVRRFSLAFGGLVFVGLLTALICDANFRSARNAGWSLDVLGRFPSFVSAERALKIFIQSDAGDSPTMTRYLAILRSEVTAEQWKKRTLNCRKRDCLTLSSEASDTRNLSPEEISERFLTLMNRCEFSLDAKNRVTCIGERISQEHAKSWIGLLENQGTLKSWLEASDVKKQIFAIKALPLDIDNETKQKVEDIGQSADSRLKALVAVYMMSSDAVKKEKLDCSSKKDAENDACGSWLEFKNI